MRVTYFYAVMQSDCRGVVPSPGFSKSPLMPDKGKGKGAWMDKLCLCTEKSDLTNIWCSFACNSILSTWAVKQLGFWLFRGIGKGQNWFLSYTNLKWLNAAIESLWWSTWKKSIKGSDFLWAARAIGHPWIFIPSSTKAVCLVVSSFNKPKPNTS